MSRQITGYLDHCGAPIRDGDILCEPVDCYEQIAYWHIFLDEKRKQWLAYNDRYILPLEDIAPYVWIKEGETS